MNLISCCFLCYLPFSSSSYLIMFMQANRDVTRMEIFLSLMRLLEPSCDGGGVGENPNNVKMPLGVVQYPVIPATGHLRWGSKRSIIIIRGIFEMLRAGGQLTSAMTSVVNPWWAGVLCHAVPGPCSVHSESLTVDVYWDKDSLVRQMIIRQSMFWLYNPSFCLSLMLLFFFFVPAY